MWSRAIARRSSGSWAAAALWLGVAAGGSASASGDKSGGPRTSDDHLVHTHDRYQGILLDGEDLPSDQQDFERKLGNSLMKWREEKRRGVWLTLPQEKLNYAAPAVNKFGFEVHSASKDKGLTLTKWLPDTPNTLPSPASHYVGVGCLVLSRDRKKLLVVQEKNGILRNTGFWKIPTGAADAGEELAETCVRELMEETGVSAIPKGVVLFRHATRYLNGKGDFFVVFLMELSSNDDTIRIQESEIADAKWLPLEDYFAQDLSPLWPAGQVAYRHMNAAMRRAIEQPNQQLLWPAFYYSTTDRSAIFAPPPDQD